MTSEGEKTQERWKFSASIATRLYSSQSSLVLVKKASSGLWGLPAGGIEKGEDIKAAAYREAREELGNMLGGGLTKKNFDDLAKSIIIFSPKDLKTSIGIIVDVEFNFYFLETMHVFDNDENYFAFHKIPDSKDNEISGAAILSPRCLVDLLTYYEGLVFKPEFNRIAIIDWVVNWHNNYLRGPFYSVNHREAREGLLELSRKGKIEGLTLHGEYLFYNPPNALS